MRLNDVGICNHAIGLCGSTEWIQSLSDSSVAAERCKRFFPAAVELVLRQHDWSSATKLVQLAENTTTPTFEYDHSFALPFDCIKIINVYGDDDGYSPYDRWKIVGRNLFTDLDEVYLRYVQFPADYKDLDIMLAHAIAYELAMILAPTLIKDPQMYSILENAKEKACAKARAMDTLENKELYTENSVWNDQRNNIGA